MSNYNFEATEEHSFTWFFEWAQMLLLLLVLPFLDIWILVTPFVHVTTYEVIPVYATQRHAGFFMNEKNVEHNISNRVPYALGTVLVTMCMNFFSN